MTLHMVLVFSIRVFGQFFAVNHAYPGCAKLHFSVSTVTLSSSFVSFHFLTCAPIGELYKV